MENQNTMITYIIGKENNEMIMAKVKLTWWRRDKFITDGEGNDKEVEATRKKVIDKEVKGVLSINHNRCPLRTDLNKRHLKPFGAITQENFSALKENFSLGTGKVVSLPRKIVFV